jgi:hypothetical protein
MAVDPFQVRVSVNHDLNRMVDDISADVSRELAMSINNKLLGEVCAYLCGTADIEYIRDVFTVLAQDSRFSEKVTALRAARRIGVK